MSINIFPDAVFGRALGLDGDFHMMLLMTLRLTPVAVDPYKRASNLRFILSLV